MKKLKQIAATLVSVILAGTVTVNASAAESFDCHVRYGNLKTPYNLEPSRTSISQITCN